MGIRPKNEADKEHFSTRWSSPQTAATAPAVSAVTTRAHDESGTIRVIEESLEVDQRAVDFGTVHVTSHVIETPVNESVTLREEYTIERHPVDRPASSADLDAFKEQTIDVRQTAEKAVVSKTARMVKEVLVGKSAITTVQEISDTVRKTVVEVERDDKKNSGTVNYNHDF